MKKGLPKYIFFVYMVCLALSGHAQSAPVTAPTDSSSTINTLRLLIDVDAFVIDNEYEGTMTHGYTLPGGWLRPRLSYDPIEQIHLELGAHASFFNGASRYPNFAYHDIAQWKGHQYQHGIHAVPWLRADVRLGNTTITLGNLHHSAFGRMASCHDLAEPLYSKEALHSADPETGAQLRLNLKRYDLDLWIDWQSFIFNLDTHQEAFTTGITQNVALLAPKSQGAYLSLPLQVILQHRGGEIDATHYSAQTILNAGAGVRGGWCASSGVLRQAGAELMYLNSTQQKGALWHYNHGNAFWGAASVNLWNQLTCRLGYFYGARFCNLYGTPFFGVQSIADGSSRPKISTGFYAADYAHTFARHYTIGAFLHGFLARPSDVGKWQNYLSIGLTFNADMDFLLKDFKRHK